MSYRAFAAHNELIMAHGSPLGTYKLVSGLSSLMGVCCSWDVSCQAAGGGFPPCFFFFFCVVSGQVGELSAPADCWEWECTQCLGKVKSEQVLLHLGDLQRWWDPTYKQESPL